LLARWQTARKPRRLMTTLASDFKICGVDLLLSTFCRCGCASLRVHPHSTKSLILIWKCAWCGIRKDKLTEKEIKTLETYVRLFGWPVLPVTFNDDGYVYAYGQLSKMRQAPARVRWKDGGVSTVQAGYSTNNVVCLPRKGGSVVAGHRGDAAKQESG
jgi:hypothetical protein